MSTPGGAGTLRKACSNFPRAWPTGFYHGVGVPHHTGLRPLRYPGGGADTASGGGGKVPGGIIGWIVVVLVIIVVLYVIAQFAF
jgi:hypothetical protein